MHSLSVIIPALNAAHWFPGVLSRLKVAIDEAGIHDYEIIIVNDGSTDNTKEVLAGLANQYQNLVVIHQENKGRFLARKAGIERASKEYVLFVDSRIYVDKGSIKYVVDQMKQHPEYQIWNGHVRIKLGWNIFARFWQAITFIAWRKYLRHPRLVQFGLEDFDYYPKGTGFFLAPREVLLKHIRSFKPKVADMKRVSDDTALLRGLAAEMKLTIAPGFSCLYHARDRLTAFIPHTFNRGRLFVDGFLQPGNRFFGLLVLFYIMSPLAIVALFVWPVPILLTGLIVWVVGLLITPLALGVALANALSLFILAPIFAIFYGLGLWRAAFDLGWQNLRGRRNA